MLGLVTPYWCHIRQGYCGQTIWLKKITSNQFLLPEHLWWSVGGSRRSAQEVLNGRVRFESLFMGVLEGGENRGSQLLLLQWVAHCCPSVSLVGLRILHICFHLLERERQRQIDQGLAFSGSLTYGMHTSQDVILIAAPYICQSKILKFCLFPPAPVTCLFMNFLKIVPDVFKPVWFLYFQMLPWSCVQPVGACLSFSFQ